MGDWWDNIKKWWPAAVFIIPLIISYWNIYSFYFALLLFGFSLAFVYKEWEYNREPIVTHTESYIYEYGIVSFPYTIEFYSDGKFEILLGRPQCQRKFGESEVPCIGYIIFHPEEYLMAQCSSCSLNKSYGKISYKELEEMVIGYIRQAIIADND